MGILTFIRYWLFRIALYFTREGRRFRFKDLYDFGSSDPTKYGALPMEKEIEEEHPKKNLKNENDIIQVFCETDKGQILTAVICRRPDGYSNVCVVLRSANGKVYELEEKVHVDLSCEDMFSSGGLRMECVLPLKKWRISFNGLLKDQDGVESHVKFVFTGSFITSLADFTSHHTEHNLAQQLAKSGCLSLLLNPSAINEHLKELNQYVQAYTWVGKAVIDGQAEEMFAFGSKKRAQEKTSSSVRSLGSIMFYTRNGISVYYEEANIEKFLKSFNFGNIVLPSLQRCPLSDIKDAPIFSEKDKAPGRFLVTGGIFKNLVFNTVETLHSSSFHHPFNGNTYSRTLKVHQIVFDGNMGYAVQFGAQKEDNRIAEELPVMPIYHLRNGEEAAATTDKNVLSFTDKKCCNSNVTGGKASSLAVLSLIAQKSQKFKVAPGLAVTTAAYKKFIEQKPAQAAIKELESILQNNQNNLEVLSKECERIRKVFEQVPIPQVVADDIKSALEQSHPNFKECKFAVRSSACGEDSEDMSAAGQMETLLGVKGIDNIIQSVAKCWASQFSFVAVQYRRRYGQLLNCPMAVCIQEMVSSDVSGVMFTINPVSSDPKFVAITANYGLGESVVSASADPDTFMVEKLKNGTVRIAEKNIGAKKLRTVMLENGGTKDIKKDTNDDSSCLTDEQIMELGRTAILLEQMYASPRDTEWAFHKNQLFMLQARPVTNVHTVDIDFEYLHENDEGVLSNDDCLSKANVGEVFGGSTAVLSFETTFRSFLASFKMFVTKGLGLSVDDISHGRDLFMVIQNRQSFFGTSGPMFGDGESLLAKGFSIALSGRIVDDEIAVNSGKNKSRYTDNAKNGRRKSPLKLISELWNAEKILLEAEKRVMSTKPKQLQDYQTEEMLLKCLSDPEIMSQALIGHAQMITYGSLNNVLVLALLAHTEGDWNHRVFSDFASMVGSCNDVVSADIPLSLQRIALQVIKDFGEEFRTKPVDEALKILREGTVESCQLFQKFVKVHGHRCLKEFDLVTYTWGMDPRPVITTVQAMMGNIKGIEHKEVDLDDLISSLQIKLNPVKRMILKFLLSRVRKGISLRERGKSQLIYSTHIYRQQFRQLSARLVAEGRLPEEDLMFYLYPYEIRELIRTRSAKIINRAMHRMNASKKAAKDIYTELNAGLPIKAMNHSEEVIAVGDRSMKGTPVSQGKVVAPCRVILSLDKAHEIQKGDILITYATDIGWSPYFPLLSGIVTELGGLISHGAVVAREYGLPCIVGAHGATNMFKSGEMVVLDGTAGSLQTVKQD